jgi:hypothetical protein
MDILFELANTPNGQGVQWPSFNLLLIKRIVESRYVKIHPPRGGYVVAGELKLIPYTLTLEEIGRDFLRELGTHEL